MTKAEIVKVNLYGLRYYPDPFPDKIWESEFKNVSEELFIKAVKKIRSTMSRFPTYSEVHTVISSLQADVKPTYEAPVLEMTEEEMTINQEIRSVFWKWWKKIRIGTKNDLKTLEAYYGGVALDYNRLAKKHPSLSSDRTFMQGIEDLFNKADDIKRRLINQEKEMQHAEELS